MLILKVLFLVGVFSASETNGLHLESLQSSRNLMMRDIPSRAHVRDDPLSRSTKTYPFISRRSLVSGLVVAAGNVQVASALVEGNKPPPKKGEAPKSLGDEYRQGTAAMTNTEEVLPESRFVTLGSGVKYADLVVGTGAEVSEGNRVNLQWVLRRSNGYFVDSSAVDESVPFVFTVGDRTGAVAGLDQAVRGMKTGGARRILIPPNMAYVEGLEDGKPGPVPKGFGPKQQMRRVMEVRKDVPGEYIYLEVRLTRVR